MPAVIDQDVLGVNPLSPLRSSGLVVLMSISLRRCCPDLTSGRPRVKGRIALMQTEVGFSYHVDRALKNSSGTQCTHRGRFKSREALPDFVHVVPRRTWPESGLIFPASGSVMHGQLCGGLYAMESQLACSYGGSQQLS